jgi:hypothetical protein
MIDRRELADRPDLALTEARVRGAIRALEAIGYLERGLTTGSTHKATEDGLRRKPIRFVFGSEYVPLFRAANQRARRAHKASAGGDRTARRVVTPSVAPRPSTAFLEGQALNSPKDKSEANPQVNLGEIKQNSSPPAEPSQDSALERALQRLKEAIGKPRGFSSENNE